MTFLQEFALEKWFVSINIKTVSIVYQIKERFIRNLLSEARKTAATPDVRRDRPPGLSDEQEEELVQLILPDTTQGKFMKKRRLLDLVERQYKTILTDGWIMAFWTDTRTQSSVQCFIVKKTGVFRSLVYFLMLISIAFARSTLAQCLETVLLVSIGLACFVDIINEPRTQASDVLLGQFERSSF
jgi:hypothetical protein